MVPSTTRRAIVAVMAGLSTSPVVPSSAQAPTVIRLGVLSDFSGPYRDWSGTTTLACVQQAVEEMRVLRPELRVEVLQAVYDRVVSYEESATPEVIRAELDKAIDEAGIAVSEETRQALATHIDDRGGREDVATLL